MHQTASRTGFDLKPIRPRTHLAFLDGMRGLCALYVVCGHFLYWDRHDNSRLVRYLVSWASAGVLMVGIFIVVSGYSLMYPVTRSIDKTLRGGTWLYLRRRARRIMPAYFMTYLLALLQIGCALYLGKSLITEWPVHLTRGDVLSHLLLVHNWKADWMFSLVPPLWSVGVEWQIYFLLPLILLPLWRRMGGWLILVVLAGSLIQHLALGGVDAGSGFLAYTAIFTMGMLGATLPANSSNRRWVVDQGWLSAGVWVGCRVLLSTRWAHHPFVGVLLPWAVIISGGAAGIALIVYCAQFTEIQTSRRRPLLLCILESKAACRLGAFSYSLYLTHYFVYELVAHVTQAMHFSPDQSTLIRGLIGIPAAVAFAYLFHIPFERPFVSKPSTGPSVATTHALQPQSTLTPPSAQGHRAMN